jgi:hypothetical protein
VWVGCGGGGGTDVVLPALSITTSTAGVELDPDGYSVTVDAAQNQAIGVNATVVVEQLADGQHTLALNGLAPNCAASGENPRNVTVHSGATASVDFAVTCGATSGGIEVLASVTGSGSDPDGFTLLLDGSEHGSVVSGVAATLSALAPGTHTVGLSGLAANCQVSGDNPRGVNVVAGQTAQVPFAVSCTTPGPSTGALEIITTTTGSDPDPDGYSLRLDTGTPQPISSNATLTLVNLTAAQHSVRLLGMAANCSLTGANPAQVSVPVGGTATVSFSVTCVPNTATTGGIQISVATTGSSPDLDGYSLSVDGGTAQHVDVNGSRTVGSLSQGSHSVLLGGVAGNCTVGGDNPRAVAVTAGQNAPVAFAVTCTTPAPGTGSIRITTATTGSPADPDGYTVKVDNGNTQPLDINGSKTIDGLEAGSHSVELGGVAQNCTLSGDNSRSVTVTAGQAANVSFAVACVATAPSLNLRIDRIYLTQSTQRQSDDVPLVQGRDAFLRVFVVANNSNSARPTVRVRLFQGDGSTPVHTFTIQPPGASTPTAPQDGTLSNTWNLELNGEVIQPGLSVLVDVDPEKAVTETDEGDNSFPSSGSAQPFSVRTVAPARILFVPVQQSADLSLIGNVNAGNKDRYVDYAQRIYPLRDVQTNVHKMYTTTTSDPLEATDGNTAWETVLSELFTLRAAESSDETYFGIAHVEYQTGLVGLAYLGVPVGLSWDDPQDVSRAVAHELGHTWGQMHAPCGGPAPQSIDPNYPYSRGTIGVYGFDVRSSALKSPSVPDIMGYCDSPWVSDYTYRRVLDYRSGNQSSVTVSGQKQASLLVWGRIVNGQPVLEPVFQILARPTLPSRPGPYSIEGTAADGARLFGFSFEAVSVADGPQSSQHFAFTIPLDQARAARLQSVRLVAAGGRMSARGPALAAAPSSRAAPSASDDIVVQGESRGAVIKWNASAHPMVMVRDPDTGEVLSFARGGSVRVSTEKRQLDLEVSDGTRSHRVRRAINR